MKAKSEEPIGPCPCGGTICNNAFGWVFGGIRDLTGNMHSGLYNVTICEMFPEEMLEWDSEDGIFLPPPPPGMNVETIKGFMEEFRGTRKDLQKGRDGIVESERMMKKIRERTSHHPPPAYSDEWSDEHA